MRRRIIVVMLCAVMILSLAACGGKKETSGNTPGAVSTNDEGAVTVDPNNPWAGLVDTSKEETMVMYVIGTEPNDMDEVLELINERLMELVNTKLELNFISLADWPTKYPLILTGGDDVDIVYTSGWTQYTDQAKKGAFVEITDDFRSSYMPKTNEMEVEAAWKQAYVDGHVYAIPRNYTENQSYGSFVIRKDIMDKYGISEINTFEDLENFLYICAGNETEGYGYNVFPSLPMTGELMLPQENLFQVYNNLYWDADDVPAASDKLEFLYMTDEYHEYILKMAEWAAKGVWPSNAISSTTHTTDQWDEGKSFINGARLQEAADMINQQETKGHEVVYVNLIPEGNYTRLSNYSGDMMAISSFSKNPERSAVVLDILKCDPQTQLLCQGGVEGRHYILNEDGTRSNGPEYEDYSWSAWAWGLREASTYLQEGVSEQITKIESEYKDCLMPDDMWIFDGFTTDDTKYKAEIAVINAIINEYQYSFDLGVYGDETEVKYQEFTEKLKEAGLDDAMAEWIRQAKEYTGK